MSGSVPARQRERRLGAAARDPPPLGTAAVGAAAALAAGLRTQQTCDQFMCMIVPQATPRRRGQRALQVETGGTICSRLLAASFCVWERCVAMRSHWLCAQVSTQTFFYNLICELWHVVRILWHACPRPLRPCTPQRSTGGGVYVVVCMAYNTFHNCTHLVHDLLRCMHAPTHRCCPSVRRLVCPTSQRPPDPLCIVLHMLARSLHTRNHRLLPLHHNLSSRRHTMRRLCRHALCIMLDHLRSMLCSLHGVQTINRMQPTPARAHRTSTPCTACAARFVAAFSARSTAAPARV